MVELVDQLIQGHKHVCAASLDGCGSIAFKTIHFGPWSCAKYFGLSVVQWTRLLERAGRVALTGQAASWCHTG